MFAETHRTNIYSGDSAEDLTVKLLYHLWPSKHESSGSNMGKWVFVYREIGAAAVWGQSQQEQLGVLGWDARTNKRCPDYLVEGR